MKKLFALALLLAGLLPAQEFPSGLPDRSHIPQAIDFCATTLNANINNSTLELPVASTACVDAALASPGAVIVRVNDELVKITSTDTGPARLVACSGCRGFSTSAAASHLSGDRVAVTYAAEYHESLARELIAGLTAIGANLSGIVIAQDAEPSTCTAGVLPFWLDTNCTASQCLYFCKTTDTWQLIGDGGSGSPGGSDGQVQFNSTGALDGDAGLSYTGLGGTTQLNIGDNTTATTSCLGLNTAGANDVTVCGVQGQYDVDVDSQNGMTLTEDGIMLRSTGNDAPYFVSRMAAGVESSPGDGTILGGQETRSYNDGGTETTFTRRRGYLIEDAIGSEEAKWIDSVITNGVFEDIYEVVGGGLNTLPDKKFYQNGHALAQDVKMFLVGDGVNEIAATDDRPGVWYEHEVERTITRVFCKCETASSTLNINFQRDDGTPADVLTAPLACDDDGQSSCGDDAGEHLSEGDFTTSTDWTPSDDYSISGGQVVWTHSSGAGFLVQETVDMAAALVPGVIYKLTYTVGSPTGDAQAQITTGTAAVSVNLDMSVGTHSTVFTAHSNVASLGFVLGGFSSSGGFTLDDMTLTVNSPCDVNTISAEGVVGVGDLLDFEVASVGATAPTACTVGWTWEW